MVRKCGRATEAAEVSCGSSRRGGNRAELVGDAKRRKLTDGGGSIRIPSAYMQLRSRRILLGSSVPRETVSLGCGPENPSSGGESGFSSSSCCSGDESSGSRSDVHGYADLEADRSSDTETSAYGSEVRDEGSREFMENSSSTIKSADPTKVSNPEFCCSGGKRTSTKDDKEKMEAPTKAELEEFFSAAEKQHREKFSEKYNFDFLKEKPSEGRYEWVKLSH